MSLVETPVSVSLKKILLATDFSSASEKAAAYAKALARRFGSTVEIAHVFDPSVVTSYEEATLGMVATMKRQSSDEELERVRSDFYAAGIDVSTTSPEGHSPAPDLLKLAKQRKVDVIVAGTSSRRGLERLILGSTAEELIRNAPCPVLTVGPNADPPADKPLFFERILYATDFSAEADKAAAFALSFAEDSGARLLLCYIFDPAKVRPTVTAVVDDAFKRALQRLVPESSYDWCNPEFLVEHGEAAEAILGVAARVKPDLIVLGARRSSFWLTHVERGVTTNLLAEAHCPVMTVC